MTRAERPIVLNVDDYEAGRYASARVLRQAGFEVREAASGEEALRMARHELPDLIVLDVNLPDIDGFEVCRRLRAAPETGRVPVLYLSAAYRAPEHRVQGLELGADGYLTQPVDPAELVATVNALLRRRHVREAVERSEKRMRSLMAATSDLIWTTDREGCFTGDQPDWSAFTGQTTEESLGWGWLDAVHPDEREEARRRWSEAVATRGAYEAEQRLRTRDGEYREMQVRAVPVTEPDGSVREWVGAHADISERARSERTLRERNERLQFLSDAATRLLMTGDPSEYADHLFDQLSAFLELDVYLAYLASGGEGEGDQQRALVLHSYRGVTPEQAAAIDRIVPGDPPCDFRVADSSGRVVESVQDAVDTRFELVRSLGITAYACYPLLTGQRLIGSVAFGTRQRPRFTDDELSLMQTVCNQIAVAVERARLIDALRERADALEVANRAKADFLATMSHELRTPLNAMIGYTDLLRLGLPAPLPQGAVDHVERIRGAAVHLTRLIEEVLTHARLEAGHDELHLESVDLPALVDEVAGMIEPLARAKGLDFEVDRVAAGQPVDTDPGKIRQILLNLLGNAVKFTERGSVSLQVRTERDALRFEVRDTGIGIARANLERVFDPFWQVDGSKTRVAGGTGLGLGVVRQLAQRLGGSVEARSEVGEGSVFVVRLPLSRPPRSAPGSTAAT